MKRDWRTLDCSSSRVGIEGRGVKGGNCQPPLFADKCDIKLVFLLDCARSYFQDLPC